MNSLEVGKLWWSWMLGSLVLTTGCGGSAKDDCVGACNQFVSCSGTGSEESCEQVCSDLTENAEQLGCGEEFGDWASCAASTNQCSANASAACEKETNGLAACAATSSDAIR